MTTFKRKVFYLGGFDPRGSRYYHQLHAEQHAPGEVGPRQRRGRDATWQVRTADGACETEVHFLVWDDLVRAHWIKGMAPLLMQTARAYWRFWRHGQWQLTRRVPRGSKIALVYPGLALLLLPLLLALPIGALLAALLRLAGLSGWWAPVPALVAGFFLGLTMAKRIHALWLLRFIIFNDQLASGQTSPALGERLDRFAETLAQALDDPVDEVLLVTHSNGSILTIPVLARLLDQRGALPANFALVTLGSSIPLVAFRRDAGAYHAACDRVAAAEFRWLDVGSLTDGAAIPLVPPLLGRPVDAPAGLVQLSPRWFRYCDPATYALRRRDKYNTHFDYLRRLDRASPLDYLGLTAAPRPLAASIAAFEAENA